MPNTIANWRVIRDVYWLLHGEEMPENFQGWTGIDVARVNQAARELLEISTERNSGI